MIKEVSKTITQYQLCCDICGESSSYPRGSREEARYSIQKDWELDGMYHACPKCKESDKYRKLLSEGRPVK